MYVEVEKNLHRFLPAVLFLEMIFENFAKCYFLICIADKGQQDPKGPQDIGVEVEPKSKPLPNVERPFRPCKLPQLLLAKFFFVKTGNCNYRSGYDRSVYHKYIQVCIINSRY